MVALLRAVAILDQGLSCLSTKAVPLSPKILSTQSTLPVSIDWIVEEGSFEDDQRYKSLYKVLEEGEKVLLIYKEKLAELFTFLSDK